MPNLLYMMQNYVIMLAREINIGPFYNALMKLTSTNNDHHHIFSVLCGIELVVFQPEVINKESSYFLTLKRSFGKSVGKGKK